MSADRYGRYYWCVKTPLQAAFAARCMGDHAVPVEHWPEVVR